MQTEPEPKPPRAHWLMQFFGNFRFIMVLAVVSTCVGSAVLLVVGTIDVFASIWDAVTGTDTDQLKVTLIDTVDTFMVATVLMVIAFGLYQLFVNPRVDLPSVLQTRSFGELEKRLASMVIVVLAVSFLSEAVNWNGDANLLGFGVAIGVVMLGVSAFLYQEARWSHKDRSDDEK
jgi:uncharacterized membrane protein YqhA